MIRKMKIATTTNWISKNFYMKRACKLFTTKKMIKIHASSHIVMPYGAYYTAKNKQF